MSFKRQFRFEDRCNESYRVLNKHPDKFPVICEKSILYPDLPNINKIKYLIPHDITIGQFIYIIKQRIDILPEEAIFLFISNKIANTSSTIGELYTRYKDADGFLYFQYSKENVFGGNHNSIY